MKTTTIAGGLLREARQALKLTLQEVGDGMDPPVSASYICDVEFGRRPPTPDRVPQFAKLLKLSASTVNAVYRDAEILPKEVAQQLSRAPEIWGANFKALVPLLAEAAEALRANQPKLAARLEKAARLPSPREKASTR
jgi:transcriptional regulator with XRE-family HTH domain